MSSFSCTMCPSVFNHSSNLRRHFRSCHANLRMFMCDQCNQLFNRSDHLKRHYNIHLKSYTKTICGINLCKKAFKDPEKLNAHRELHKKKLEEGLQMIHGYFVKKENINGSLMFICPIDGCNKQYSSYIGINKHLKFHIDPEKMKELRRNVKIYTCEECSKTFTKKIRLKNHLEKTHTQSDIKSDTEQSETKVDDDKKYFICPYEGCRRIYSKKSNVTMHIVRNHTKEVYFKCDDCGFPFKWRNSLNTHKCKSKT